MLLVQAGGPGVRLLTALSRYGLRLVVGGNAVAAMEIAARIPLRAIVADYRLPDRSGVWLLQQMRIRHAEVQRVLVADDPRLDVSRLLENGICHAAMAHPFAPDALIDVLAGVPRHADRDDTPIVTPEARVVI